jgi:arylsulfatase A
MKSRTHFGLTLLFIITGLMNVGTAENAESMPKQNRPNILFILADDLGIDGLGCYGSDRFKGRTPNIDALAANGVRFDRCYSAPVCGPARCLFITGRYPFRTGGLSNGSAGRLKPTEEPSVAKILKQARYVTGMAGKWRQMGGLAGEWGFEDYRMSDVAASPSEVNGYIENGRTVQKEERAYYPDVQQAFALEFLRRHREHPFFFYYASHLVHDPIVATPDTKPETKTRWDLYNDNVAYLDKQVGELVAELERLGLRERTLIVFSGDNGTDIGRGPATIGGRSIHGGKRDMWEGGALVPLIASWKGTLPAGRAVRDLVSFTDLLPTFSEMAGAQLPPSVTFDGRSFAPQLRGEKGTPREWVFVQYFANSDRGQNRPAGMWYVRDDGWKLNSNGELFDMHDAPFVEQPVTVGATEAEPVAARKRLEAVLAELNPAAGKTEPAPKSTK